MRTIALLTAALILVCPSQGLSGQQESPLLRPGARVRVWAVGHQYIGTLTAVSDDSVWLISKKPVALPRSAVERIDVSMGRHGHTLLGLGLGFGAGFIGGAALASSVGSDSYGFGPDPAKVGAFFGTLGGLTVIGGVVGGLSKSDRWARVSDWSPVPEAKPVPVAKADTTAAVPDLSGQAMGQTRFRPFGP